MKKAVLLSALVATLVLGTFLMTQSVNGSTDAFAQVRAGTYKVKNIAGGDTSEIEVDDFWVSRNFVTLEEWNNCSSCPQLLKEQEDAPGIALGVSRTEVNDFLKAQNNGSDAPLRLLSLAEFRVAHDLGLISDLIEEKQTWLSDCKVDDDFHVPDAQERQEWNLPADWPHKINRNGRVCKTEQCLSCAVAWVQNGKIQSRDLFEDSSPNSVGIIIAK